MDLRYTDEEVAFRDELRAWLAEAVPAAGPAPDEDDWAATRAYDTGWQRTLFDAGYAGINWPKEYGGRGATPIEHLIFLEETERAGAPYVGINFVGLLHAGPTIMPRPPEDQKAVPPARHPQGRARVVPGLLRARGRLRPGLPAHPGRARRRRVRRQRPEDLDQPRPRRRLLRAARAHRPRRAEAPGHHLADRPHGHARASTSGRCETIRGAAEFSEVFFDDVRVPVANRVGDENDGWRVAMVTFSFERGTAFVSEMLGSMQLVGRPGRRSPRPPPATAPRPGRTGACAARSATWPPSSTRSGP